jgi:hypothetical protein
MPRNLRHANEAKDASLLLVLFKVREQLIVTLQSVTPGQKQEIVHTVKFRRS